MSDGDTRNGEKPDTTPEESILSLDLSFAPDWAKKPSKQGTPAAAASWDKGDDAARDNRGRGGYGGGRDRGGDRAKGPARRPKSDRMRPSQPTEAAVEAPRLPNFRLRILPTSKALASIVRQIHAAKKAYPLRRLALLLLSKPDHCFAKMELDPDRSNPSLYQCGACQTVALTRQLLLTHILQSHFADHFLVEEKECEPPSGIFVCVARCKRTGILLGPPNHHSYADKIEETRRAHFPDMPYEVYRNGIETLRDPAMIEQWKEQSKKQTLYRLKKDGVPVEGEPMKWPAAAAFMTDKVAPSLVTEVRKANVPLAVAIKVGDRLLEPVFKNSWSQETRSPRSMTLALRMAFRHMRLHVFRAGRWGDLVSTVRPCPMDWDHAVESIRRIYGVLMNQPGLKQDAVLAALQSGEPAAGVANDEVVKSLRWLVEKGHIVELFDGSLVVPHFVAEARKQGPKPENTPEPRPEPQGTAEGTEGVPAPAV